MNELYGIFGFVFGASIASVITWLSLKAKYVRQAAEYEAQQKTLEDIRLRQAAENDAHKKMLVELHQRFNTEFNDIASKIIDDKTKKFTDTQKVILDPLKENIGKFEEKVNAYYRQEGIEKASLKTEILHITQTNTTLREQAEQLTLALRGDKKFQGNWGEIQLERLIEHSGAKEVVHFKRQPSFTVEKDSGDARVIPDCIVELPNDKQIVIDSKVTLIAYAEYVRAKNNEEKEKCLKQLVGDIRKHINGLSEKNYQNITGINSLDFVFMFFALEPALYVALEREPLLFEEAIGKNVMLVSNTTLLTAMRTVAFMWKQKKQKQYVLKILQESGKLYDYFADFTKAMIEIKVSLDKSQQSYDAAMRKLTTSTKQGLTIIGKLEQIREYGAKHNKRVNQELVNQARANEEIAIVEEEVDGLNSIAASREKMPLP